MNRPGIIVKRSINAAHKLITQATGSRTAVANVCDAPRAVKLAHHSTQRDLDVHVALERGDNDLLGVGAAQFAVGLVTVL